MRISLSVVLLAALFVPLHLTESSELPRMGENHAFPQYLEIPVIDLKAPVVEVGTNEKGEMDVPEGTTNNVGWYKYGTLPGQQGSAVMDAHVYAAFKNLKGVSVGDDVYVDSLHFKVTEVSYYQLADLPLKRLFNADDRNRLNLITCAGTWDSARQTYDHRLVVYAELVDDEALINAGKTYSPEPSY